MDGLRDRHEVTLHLRVGDGDRTTPRNLTLEDGNDAPPTSQDIAKSHGDKIAPASMSSITENHLRHTLRRPHHARRLYGFIRGDEHKTFRPKSEGSIDDVLCPQHIVGDRLFHIEFHKGKHAYVRLHGRRLRDGDDGKHH